MDIEKIKGIFIEEATEIIESLDVDIINLEENPADKEYLNNVFRGVHTLKGSANSFGFTRLGTFVHSFEDLLDHYRLLSEEMPTEVIDLCLESVDLVKELFQFEIDSTPELPLRYEEVLERIHEYLSDKKGDSTSKSATLADLSNEFGDDFDTTFSSHKELRITFTLDDDIYIRGLEPLRLIKNLKEFGTIKDIEIDANIDIPSLDTIEPNKNYLKINLTLETNVSPDEIEESFIYLDASEFTIVAPEIKSEVKTVSIPQADVTLEAAVKEVVAPAKNEEQAETKESAPAVSNTKVEQRSFVKLDTNKLDELFDTIGELVIAQNYLSENPIIRSIEDETVEKTLESLNKITRLVQNRVMSLRMVPIRDSFEKMKRVIRDASKKVNKEVEFVIHGEETEIDKTIVEKLADPLIHLVRNAVDHGLETNVQDRINQGKPAVGTVRLEAFHKGGNIIIQINDDGRGINKDIVLKRAIEKGIVEADAVLNEQQIYQLILMPGFSTAAVISDISGRGVGLDVVRSNIESIRGKIEIESVLGKGSTFRIVLPLTLAIIDGMLVRCAGDVFIIPTLSVFESFTAKATALHTIKGKGEFVQLREEMIPLVRLNIKLELNDKIEDIDNRTIICIENDKGKMALFIDELIGRQQVVVKSIGNILKNTKEISGGAVLGNGDIALILNVDELG